MDGEKAEPGLRWPGRWFWALAACWMAGVAFYWWHFVPAVPEKVIKYKPGQIMGGYTADALLLAQMSDFSAGFYREGGPVDVVDLKTGTVLRRIGKEHQFFEHVPGVNHVLLASAERWEIVDANTGGVVMTRPFDSPADEATLSSDGNRVAVNSGDRVSMFDVHSGEQLWSRQFREEEEPISARDEQMALKESKASVMMQFGRFVHVYLHAPQGSFSSTMGSSWWVDARTGEPDPRFKNAVDIIESPDGRYVLVEEDKESPLVSLDDGRVLCRIPIQSGEIYEFTRDSREIRELSLSESGPRLSRWSIPDGKAIGPAATDPERQILNGWISEDGRRFAVCESISGLFDSMWLMGELTRMGLGRIVDPWMRIRQRAVLRTADGSPPLLLASDGWFEDEDSILGVYIQPIGRGDRFAVAMPDRVLIFRFDPPRNWWWLAGWGLGPVAAVMGVNRWRAPRRAMASTAG